MTCIVWIMIGCLLIIKRVEIFWQAHLKVSNSIRYKVTGKLLKWPQQDFRCDRNNLGPLKNLKLVENELKSFYFALFAWISNGKSTHIESFLLLTLSLIESLILQNGIQKRTRKRTSQNFEIIYLSRPRPNDHSGNPWLQFIE